MKISSFIGGSLLCLPLASGAQMAADAASPAPAVLYRSVFSDTPKGVETESVDWKAANSEVGQFTRGHVDILKWEATQAKAKASGTSVPITPGADKPAVKP